MSLLKKIKEWFSGSGASQDRRSFCVTVRCRRCGEQIRARVDLSNDLSLQDDGSYYCRKVLMGEGHCFQRIEVEVTFSAERRLIGREIQGGSFVD
jgi:hypothetical protein